MQLVLFFTSALHICSGYSVDPITNEHAIPYPEYGRVGDPNASQTRRRPLLVDSFSSPISDLAFVPTWPKSPLSLGQVAAVTVDQHNQVIIFHRGNHVWNGQSFNLNDQYLRAEDGPINDDPVIVLHPTSGIVLKSWGKNLFYMPHGLTTDHEDNLWVTDVALHQVFKFPPLNVLNNSVATPLLKLGERFIPGKDNKHFCKPSAVSVLSSGDFFVADGYCNYRVIKYNSEGQFVLTWGRSSFKGFLPLGLSALTPYQFNIPHALTLAEDRGLLCVADRENGRVLCFSSNNGTFAYQISSKAFGSLVFSVAYSSVKGGLFYIVNGPDQETPVKGFVVDANNLQVVSAFPGGNANLSNPHDVAVSPDGDCVYVAQLDPHRVLKFAYKNAANSAQFITSVVDDYDSTSTKAPHNLSSQKLIAAVPNTTAIVPPDLNLMANSALSKAISIPLWAMITITVIVLGLIGTGVGFYVRAQQRVYPAMPSEGFKLGQLLDPRDRRGRMGFEQVSTEESDEDRVDGDQAA